MEEAVEARMPERNMLDVGDVPIVAVGRSTSFWSRY